MWTPHEWISWMFLWRSMYGVSWLLWWFEQPCPKEYVRAQYIANYYGPLQSSCVNTNHARYAMRSTPTYSLMVTGCSNDSVSCESNMINVTSILEHGAPVIDTLYGLVFANAKCAVCNGVPPLRLRPLETKLNCESLRELSMSDFWALINSNMSLEEFGLGKLSNNLRFGEGHAVQRDNVDLTPGHRGTFKDPMAIVRDIISKRSCIVAFDLLKAERHCAVTIATCPNNCTNKEMVSLCHNGHHSLIVSNDSAVTYRNIYCALCNIGPHNDFKCGHITSLGIIPAGSFSLSLLFDVSGDDNVVLQSLSTTCTHANQQIPGDIHCGQVVCPKAYTYSGNGCSAEVMRFVANVSLAFDILVETSRSCNQTANVDDLTDELHIAFIHAVGSLLNKSESNIEISISYSCFYLTSNYSIDVLVSISSSVDLQDISSSMERVGIMTVWNVFNETLYDSHTPGDAIRITSENITIIFTKPGLEATECDGFLLTADDRDIPNGSLSINATSSAFNKRILEAVHFNAPMCVTNKRKIQLSNLSEGLGYTTIALSSMSLFSLGLRITLQAFYKPYHTSAGKMQFQFSLAVAFANGLLLTSPLAGNIPHLCAIFGALKYMSFISSFAWMTCVSGDTWRIFRPSNLGVTNNVDYPILKLSLIAWIVPITFSSVVFAIDYIGIDIPLTPGFGGNICWFTNWVALLTFFVAPVGVSIILNVVFFTLTWISLRTTLNSTLKEKSTLTRKQHQVYFKMFLLMGMTWSTLFVAVFVNVEAIWYIFVICNASQGCYLFIAFAPERNWWECVLEEMTVFRSRLTEESNP